MQYQIHLPTDCTQKRRFAKDTSIEREWTLCAYTFGLTREYKTPLKWSFCLVQVLFGIKNAAHKQPTATAPTKGISASERTCRPAARPRRNTLLHPKMNGKLSLCTFGGIHFESRSSQESISVCFQPLIRQTRQKKDFAVIRQTCMYKIPTLWNPILFPPIVGNIAKK